MSTAILVPRRAEPWRDQLWDHVRAHVARGLDWPIVEGYHDDGPFNRSAAVNTAARAAGNWDVAVILDSDVIVGHEQLRQAADVARLTGRLVMAFHAYQAVTRQGTDKVLEGFAGSWRGMTKHTLYDSCSVAIAFPRKLWDAVRGFDERFVGWGWEDVAFACACHAIAGPRLVVHGDAWHLWHPRSPERDESSALFRANRALVGRYRQARHNPDDMRELVAEHGGWK